jgi:hypothetical protein
MKTVRKPKRPWTNTGAVLESMVLPALKRGGYSHRKQVHVGSRPGGDVTKWTWLPKNRAMNS